MQVLIPFLSSLVVLFAVSDEESRRRHIADGPRSSQPFQNQRSVSDSDLEIVRQRVIDDLLAPEIDTALVKTLTAQIQADGSWPDIDYQDVSSTGFEHSRHLRNMYHLSRAHKKKESPYYQDAEVKKHALSALDFWLDHDFICDNWWWNEMGTPNLMINTLLVLDTDLTETQAREGLRIAGRANLEASGARPGGDLIQIAGMLGKQALFRRDKTIMDRVTSVMADQVRITTGRGLKPDMSFHHRVDNVICTLSYGLGYATVFSDWALKVADTKYRFPDHTVNLLTDFFLDGICKSMVHAKYPDPGAKNRDLTRKGTLRAASPELAENLARISDYRKSELEEVIRIRKGEIDPHLSWNRFFWHSEYFTHQRPGYFASVRMHSSRNHTMEQPHNEEGLKMHHVGDGSNFVSRTGREYLDIFPVWDWQKIPGTTVVQKPVHPHWREIARKGLTDFVGGVSDGEYGAAAFDFRSPHDALKARKAWFFFDDAYVCLGSAITAEAEYPVLTTLNQCLLNTPVAVRTRREKLTLQKGTHDFSEVSWVLHDGVGYVFPDPQDVHITNGMANGSWRQINHQATSSKEPVQMEVFTLWLDHGVKPQGAAYAYIVVPSGEARSMENYTKNSTVEILANDEPVQAVTDSQLQISQIVFYRPGKLKLPDNVVIKAESPCMLVVKTNEKHIERMTVSDPSRQLAELLIRTSAVVTGSGPGWRATWFKKEKESVIEIDLPRVGYAGESVTVEFPVPE
jgi:chondroitin AC lyase